MHCLLWLIGISLFVRQRSFHNTTCIEHRHEVESGLPDYLCFCFAWSCWNVVKALSGCVRAGGRVGAAAAVRGHFRRFVALPFRFVVFLGFSFSFCFLIAGYYFGRFRSFSVVFGRVRSFSVVFGRFRSFSVVFGRVPSFSVVFGRKTQNKHAPIASS